MKLLSFTGTKINEYIDIDIDFNTDLSILIGTNGSGKTTALNIIQALLLPKIVDLITIPFESINLRLENKSNIYNISVNKKQDYINFDILNNFDEKLVETFKLNKDYIDEFDIYKLNKTDKKKQDFYFKKFINEQFFQFIDKLPKPILIGLERTNNNVKEEYNDFLFERKLFMSNDNRRSYHRHKDNLGVSSLETEMLVQRAYKRVKSIRDNYFNKVNKELITSSFDFIDFNPNDIININELREKFSLLEQRSEIEETLKNIGFLDSELSQKLKDFFEKINTLVNKLDKKDQSVTIEWLLNKSQFDRLHNILGIIKEYNIKAEKIYLPVKKFIEIINSFLKDTGKKIYVDEVGRLLIKKPAGRNLTIDELSSGERQLVILFANVIFARFDKNYNSDILIIDEPEISLHIRWQEKFIDLLFETETDKQFIIATHSPDIIGEYKFKSLRLNKNK